MRPSEAEISGLTGSDEQSPLRHQRGRLTVWFLELFLTRIATLPLDRLEALAAKGSAERLSRLWRLEGELKEAGARLYDLLYAEVPKAADPQARSRLLTLRRKVFAGEPADLASTGGLSLGPAGAALEAYAGLHRQRSIEEKAARDAFNAERQRLRGELLSLCLTPQVSEGLLLDSDSLFQAARRLGSGSDDPKALRRFEQSASQFIARWCCRPTPLSTVTAVSLGRVTTLGRGVTVRRSAPGEIRRRRVGISAEVARLLASAACEADDGWRRVRPRLNPTHALRDGNLEFWRPSSEPGEEELCVIPAVRELQAFVRLARPRTLEAGELVADAARELGLNVGEAESIYHGLVRAGLVLGNLEIPLEEPDPVGFIRRWVEGGAGLPELGGRLRELEQALAVLERHSPEPPVERPFERVRELIAADLPQLASASMKQLLSLDSESSWEAEIGSDTLGPLADAVAVLDRLQDFKEGIDPAAWLRARFEGRDELPLLSLWEAETSFKGAPEAWREGLGLRLNGWLAASLKPGDSEIELRAETLDELLGPEAVPRDDEHHAHVRFSAYPRPDGGEDLVLDQVFGNVVTAFARWLPLFSSGAAPRDHEAFAVLRRTCDLVARRHADLQLVDVIYHSGAWGDQVAWHPGFWPLSVEANGKSRSPLPGDRIIPVSELHVRIEGGKPRIEWIQPGGRRLPVGLCYNSLLETRSHRWISFAASFVASFLPTRVHEFFDPLPRSEGVRWLPAFRCGRAILQTQTWLVDRARYPPVSLKDDWERFRAVARWRSELALPRRVWVSSERGEAARLVDFENPLLVDALLADLRNDPGWTVMMIRDEPFLFESGLAPCPYARQYSVGLYWKRETAGGAAKTAPSRI